MKIGKVELKNKYVLAPMAGYTDVAFRELCAEHCPGLTVTEMISAKGLLHEGKKTVEMLRVSKKEGPVCVQLFGSDPSDFERVISFCRELDRFDIIDINMGCPVAKVVKQGEGSALMKDVKRAQDIVRACKNATDKPVTAKFRLGWDTDCGSEFARAMQEAGADAVTVHGRTALQMYRGSSDIDAVRRIKECIEIPLIASGDFCLENAQTYADFDGIMIGRGALGRPDIFSVLQGADRDDSAENVHGIILAHIEKMKKYFESERFIVANMRKHYAYYFKRYRVKSEMKNALNLAPTLDEVYSILEKIFKTQ